MDADLKNLRRSAAKYRAKVAVTKSGRFVGVDVIAPRGKVWACDGVHELALHWYAAVDDKHSGKPEAIADALDRMRSGLANCDEPDCDYCEEAPVPSKSKAGKRQHNYKARP